MYLNIIYTVSIAISIYSIFNKIKNGFNINMIAIEFIVLVLNLINIFIKIFQNEKIIINLFIFSIPLFSYVFFKIIKNNRINNIIRIIATILFICYIIIIIILMNDKRFIDYIINNFWIQIKYLIQKIKYI